MVTDGREARLIWKERDQQLVFCVLEDEVGKVLADLHDGHMYFAAGVQEGRAPDGTSGPLDNAILGDGLPLVRHVSG